MELTLKVTNCDIAQAHANINMVAGPMSEFDDLEEYLLSTFAPGKV